MSKIGRRDGEEPIFANVLREWLKAEDAQLRLWAQEHKSYWYLTLIGVDPAQTNHGIGESTSSLCDRTRERANLRVESGHKLVSWGKKQAMSCTERAVEVREPVTIMATLGAPAFSSASEHPTIGLTLLTPPIQNRKVTFLETVSSNVVLHLSTRHTRTSRRFQCNLPA